jgi:hypothetical protein
MTRRMVPLCVLLLGVASAVYGQTVDNLDERVVPIQGAPLLVTSISAGWQAPAWASQQHQASPVPTGGPALPVYLQVQNASQQTMLAYRVMVVVYDPFGDWLDSYRLTAISAIAPGGQDYGRWSPPIRQAYLSWTVVAYVEAVRFQDGSIWRAAPESAAAMIPGAAPVRYQTWHTISMDPRDIIFEQAKDAG